jgi:hypothetical protein
MFSRVRYFLRSQFRINENNEPEPTENSLPLIAAENNENPLTLTRRRKCGFCRVEGHFVNVCNNQRLIECKEQIQIFINELREMETVDEWLFNKPLSLLKAIGCSYRLFSFSQRISQREAKTRLLRHILTQQAIIILQSNQQREPRIHLHRIGRILREETETTEAPLSQGPEYYYRLFGINIENSNEGEEIMECPICYEDTNREICVLNCGHCFCKTCLDNTLKNTHISFTLGNRAKCPLCREIISIVKRTNSINS